MKLISFFKEAFNSDRLEKPSSPTRLVVQVESSGKLMNEEETTTAANRILQQCSETASSETEATAAETFETDQTPAAETDQPEPVKRSTDVDAPATVVSADALCSEIDSVAEKIKQFTSHQDQLNAEFASRLAADAQPPQTFEALEEASRNLRQIATQQDELKQLFESRIHSDEVQAKALERLHDEMRDYKQNFVRQEIMPLLKDIIFSYDVVAKEIERLQNEPSLECDDSPVRALEVVGQMLLDVLYKYDVEPFRREEGYFERKTQQCVGTEPTNVEEDDKKIFRVGLIVFQLHDTISRREHVTV